MGGWPVGYLHNVVEELNSRLPRTNPDSSRVEDFNQGPPDFKSSALNHSATLPPLASVHTHPANFVGIRTFLNPLFRVGRKTNPQRVNPDIFKPDDVAKAIWRHNSKKRAYLPPLSRPLCRMLWTQSGYPQMRVHEQANSIWIRYVDGKTFKSGKKKLRIQKYADTNKSFPDITDSSYSGKD